MALSAPELLTAAHDLSRFDCGKTSLNDWLHRRALPNQEKGFTVVPTKVYFRDGRVKVELALAKGKELRDKRRDAAARDARREIERELKSLRR